MTALRSGVGATRTSDGRRGHRYHPTDEVCDGAHRVTQVSRSPGRGRSNARGDATREVILLTAERLFAERGIAAVPLREICVAAGQKNSVAVQYHFGDRENLVQQLAAYRADDMIEVGAELFAELVADGSAPTVLDCVGSFIRSLARNIDDPDNHYLPFLARYLTERGGYAGLEHSLPPTTVVTWSHVMRRLLPHLPPDVMAERWQNMMVSSVHILARYQVQRSAGTLSAPLESLVADLIVCEAAGLAAPGHDLG